MLAKLEKTETEMSKKEKEKKKKGQNFMTCILKAQYYM